MTRPAPFRFRMDTLLMRYFYKIPSRKFYMILTPELLLSTRKRLERMKEPVQGMVFYSAQQGDHNQHVAVLARELQSVSPKLNFQLLPIEQNPEKAQAYHVDKTPAIVLENKSGQQARFFGLPAGEEFNVLLSDVMALSEGRPDLPHEIIHQAQQIAVPTHLQVFVTSTCPYCPGVGRLAHGLAMINPHIRADIIRIEEFQAMADKYNVMGVPRVVVNDRFAIQGQLPSDVFLRKIQGK